MNCPQCDALVVCSACGAAIGAAPAASAEASPSAPAPSEAETDQRYLVVAKGHQDLLGELRRVVGKFGWVRVIEDRRDDSTLLPRTGREGAVHVDNDVES